MLRATCHPTLSSRAHGARFGALALLTALSFLVSTTPVYAGAFLFSSEGTGVDIITHPKGYTGGGGELRVSVCVDPTSVNAAAMELPVRNIVNTWNQRIATSPNLFFGANNNIPSANIDFESVALHEVGHCISLAHPNAATESGLVGADQDYTKTTDGANDAFDINDGTDNIIGSADDVRGDDVNLHWFRTSNNNPFTIAPTVDTTTYSRDTGDLPMGHLFAANADRTVGAALGFANTEAVMQQGSFFDEEQRRVNHDDLTTLLLGMSGLDETAGTADDYQLVLTYAGLTDTCDVVLDFDDAETGFAVCQVGGQFINGTHLRITTANSFYNTGFNWFFNDRHTAMKIITDFSGDLVTDFAVYRPSNGRWFADTDRNGSADVSASFGGMNDIPVPGDYDGDDVTDFAVFRPSNGRWFADTSRNGSTDISANFGTGTDVPVPGDYNGDGGTDFAVFRPSNGMWFVDTNRQGGTEMSANFGTGTDVPVPGDYDGDGTTDFAVYRPSNGMWFVDTNRDGSADTSARFGGANDLPVPGDYDGDGITDFAIFRPSNGRWFADTNRNGGTDISANFGVASDVPVPGDYNDDGSTDFAVFRPSNGFWYADTDRNGSTNLSAKFGSGTDTPLRENGWILDTLGLTP